MPDNKQTNRRPTAADRRVNALDLVARRLLTTLDPGFAERELLSEKDRQIQAILNNEISRSKGVANGSIVDFAVAMAQSKRGPTNGANNEITDPSDLFTRDLQSIFGYYQNVYQSRYIELADLKFISKFIPALGEAVKTTLDAIVSSDDMSTSITRNLDFGPGLTEEEKIRATNEIERIEREEKLLKRLRNTVYKKVLITGQHYVYCPSYKKIFEEYSRLLKLGKIKQGRVIAATAPNSKRHAEGVKNGFNLNTNSEIRGTTESTADIFNQDRDWTVAQETYSIDAMMDDVKEFAGIKDTTILNKMKEELNHIGTITTVQSPFMIDALESVAQIDYYQNDLSGYANTFGGIGRLDDSANVTSDGTMDANEAHGEKFSVAGTYLKFIDASKIVPVKVYNQIVGYFYVHDSTASKKAGSLLTQQNSVMPGNFSSTQLFSGLNMDRDKKDNAVRSIVNTITDGILQNFSNRFVNQNLEHKKLIADCIIANGLVNNDLQIQFIPATDMVPFIINEDEDGFGQSILSDSLFPGRLLLDLVISKMLLYMNKSGSRTYAYVKKGPIDVSTSNHTQRVLRQIQEQNISFGDLLSSQMAFAKFAPYGALEMPTARNGDHLIDFEVMDGQNIDLHTDFEDWLEKMAIMGSGVPSVIMEYTDAADYAKSIITANIKFAGRVATLQSDLEDPTTDLYRVLIRNSNLDEKLKEKIVPNFYFKLPRPRVNANANLNDYLSSMQATANTMVDIQLGTDESIIHNFQLVREELIRQTVKDKLPFIDWNEQDARLKRAMIAVAKRLEEKDNIDPEKAEQNATDMAVDDALLDEEL